jgi:hypothetical protein
MAYLSWITRKEGYRLIPLVQTHAETRAEASKEAVVAK